MIHFDDKSHTYTDNIGNIYTSTTAFVKKFFPQFNKEEMAAKCSQGKNKKYAGRDPSEIIAEWELSGKEASEKGKYVHKAAEIYLTKGKKYVNKHRKLCENVFNFIKEWEYSVVDTEKILYCPEKLISGTADLILRNENGIVLGDWKTNKEIKKFGFDFGMEPISHLYNCNYIHYCLQLNIYKWLIDSQAVYGFDDVVEMKLFHVSEKGVAIYEVPDMQNEVREMINYEG